MKPLAPEIRAILKQHPDGLATKQLRNLLGAEHTAEVVNRALHSMPDAYIDRWDVGTNRNGALAAVWMVVVPPENCPHPTRKASNGTLRT